NGGAHSRARRGSAHDAAGEQNAHHGSRARDSVAVDRTGSHRKVNTKNKTKALRCQPPALKPFSKRGPRTVSRDLPSLGRAAEELIGCWLTAQSFGWASRLCAAIRRIAERTDEQ